MKLEIIITIAIAWFLTTFTILFIVTTLHNENIISKICYSEKVTIKEYDECKKQLKEKLK